MRAFRVFLLLIFLGGATVVSRAQARSQMVRYRSGNEMVSGYLALPERAGKHPAMVVIHEWWGLNDWVKGEADKLAGHGYVALAVDLYRGQSTTDPAVARKLDQSVPRERAIRDLKAAYNYLAERNDVEKDKIGAIGWCMGGGYSLLLAEQEPKLAACVVNYGELPTDPAEIARIQAPVLGTFGADDRGIPPSAAHAFVTAMKAAGKQIAVKIYEGAGHAFENPNYKAGYRPVAAKDAWGRTLEFLEEQLQ